MALINYYLGADQQAKLTELTSYAPINSDAKPKVDELTNTFPTSNVQDKGIKVDGAWWAKNQADVLTKWSAWLGG